MLVHMYASVQIVNVPYVTWNEHRELTRSGLPGERLSDPNASKAIRACPREAQSLSPIYLVNMAGSRSARSGQSG
jgi:hypothetical protein